MSLLAAWPPWGVMWSLALAFYAGAKWLTWRRARRLPASRWRHLAYFAAWPGMDAAAFLTGRATPPAPREWRAGVAATAAGLATLALAVSNDSVRRDAWTSGAVGMGGLVLLLHFGAFQLLSCAWRHGGVDARPIMHAPIRATSLVEFWGRRWNTAFRDLTHAAIFAPLRSRVGGGPAVLAGFVCSGLLHDAVISVPAGGGYGGPTLYFTLHGAALLGERSTIGRRLGLGRGLAGRAFTLAVLLLPLGCLFHRPFLERVIAPFIAALGRIA